ncbi:MAG: argininosuccinate lyase [Nitrososphaeraceae archaeon]
MYRSRPEGSIDREILNYLSSLKDDFAIFFYDIIGSEAHVIMLHEIGYLSREELVEILQALEEAKNHPKSIMKKDEYEDVHESIESFVVEKIGMGNGGMLQTARSRNDQVMTDLKMKVRNDINEISVLLGGLVESLLKSADSNKDTIMLLYTHLQHAQIGTFSHYLLSYTEALFRDMERLEELYTRINQSPLGSLAIGGSTLSVDRNRTASLLGFDQLSINSIDATTSRDVILEYLSCLSILMITLSRIAEDLILWSTDEFKYIELADSVSSTSSAMPQKKNPDPLEILRSKSGGILGNLTASMTILKGLPSGYSRDLQELKSLVFSSTSTTESSLSILRIVIESCIVHKSRMLELAKRSFANAIDVAEFLTSKEHLDFRSAHKLVGSLVRLAICNGKHTLEDLGGKDIEQLLHASGDRISMETLKEIIVACGAENSLTLRKSKGSPSHSEQVEMILHNQMRLINFRERTRKRKQAISNAYDELSKIVRSYTLTS